MRHRFLTDRSEMEEIIRKCQVCHIAMVDPDGRPYLLPFNFGYEKDILYFHSARMGKKMGILINNPHVCVEFSTDYLLRFQSEKVGCSYTMKYRSVLAYGKVEFIEDPQQKTQIMNIVMKNYVSGEFIYNPPSMNEIYCWIVKIDKLEGKINGY
jgi:nitroimidazol reductase NimA-like FMN-containing flavoprotein (pyridoxamine 5'-phosphate oxidase superfamily)